MFIKLLLLIVFFAIMVGVGIYAGKHTKSVDGFVLGGRKAGPWLTAFAYGTSYFSAVVFVGYAGQFGWKFGISSTWIGLGNAFIGSLLAWIVLGRRTRVMSHHLKSKTMPDFFGSRYQSNALKIVASIIVFVFLVPYTASIYNGLSRLFQVAFNIPYFWCVIVMALFTGIYVIAGGYMATAINDFIQGIIMLIGIVAVIWAVLSGQGGFIEAIKKMSEIPSEVRLSAGQQGAYTAFFGPDPLNLISVVILTSFGTWGLPQMVGKFYAIKDEKSINTGTVISTAFALIIAGGSYFLGGFGRLFDNPALHNESGSVIFDAVIPFMVSTLPDILIGIVIVLVLSASMSTLASLVLASSSTLTLDCLKGHIIKNMSEKRQIRVMRALVIFFIVISVVLALNPPTFIAQLMGISWGALAGAFLAPFFFGLYWKGVTKAAVWAGFASGVLITVTNLIFPFLPSPIHAGALAMIAGLVIVPLVSFITPKMNKTATDEMFACYKETVTITKVRSLEEA
ncbi:MAG: sodium/proline symporter [Lachnospiraceae bacterium]|jgi:SSS family solute:Na+ symporter|nr:sodium/proline symporter [Lachnospiraceae bacterium]